MSGKRRIGPADLPRPCLRGHDATFKRLHVNSNGWAWRCRECDRLRAAERAGLVEPPPSAWERILDAFDMWQWDYCGDRLLDAVADTCGISVAGLKRTCDRHGYVPGASGER